MHRDIYLWTRQAASSNLRAEEEGEVAEVGREEEGAGGERGHRGEREAVRCSNFGKPGGGYLRRVEVGVAHELLIRCDQLL